MHYQAWEHVADSAITHTHEQEQYSERIFERFKESREEQGNEQWHLLIIQEWINRKGLPESKVRHRFIPRLLAFGFYHLTLILYARSGPAGATASTPISRTMPNVNI